jgi:Ketopantoate reductase PanE/ApbA
MRVAVVGMGALGCVYGVRLAKRAGVDVTFVVRPGRQARRLRITRIDGDRAVDEVFAPTLATGIPPRTESVLVCVRTPDLTDDLDRILCEMPGHIIVLTPLLPRDQDRMFGKYGRRLRVGMPGVVSYATAEGEYRYWLPKLAPTLIQDATFGLDGDPLVAALVQAGLPARMEKGVAQTNVVTTLSLMPLAMALDAAGSVDALLGDKELLRTALDATKEARALASLIGKPPAWVGMLAKFLGPSTLKVGVALARRSSPEAVKYVEDHFGRKLHLQNVAMARAIVQLTTDHGTRGEALAALTRKLSAMRVG